MWPTQGVSPSQGALRKRGRTAGEEENSETVERTVEAAKPVKAKAVKAVKAEVVDMDEAQRVLLMEKVFNIPAQPEEAPGATTTFLERWSVPLYVLFALVVILSFGTRFYYVAEPKAVLFDEVHFVSMAQWYAARKYFFDIHPPLAKLCLGAIVHLTGFHTDEPYRNIGKAYLHDGYAYMRYWQAMWGSLLPILMFLISRQLSKNIVAALVVAFLVIFELSVQTISRAILLDSFLFFWMLSSLYSALKLWSASNDMYLASILPQGDSRVKGSAGLRFWAWVVVCSVCMGLAFSTKHTALGIIGLVGLFQVYKCFAPLVRYIALRMSDKDQEVLNCRCLLVSLQVNLTPNR